MGRHLVSATTYTSFVMGEGRGGGGEGRVREGRREEGLKSEGERVNSELGRARLGLRVVGRITSSEVGGVRVGERGRRVVASCRVFLVSFNEKRVVGRPTTYDELIN